MVLTYRHFGVGWRCCIELSRGENAQDYWLLRLQQTQLAGARHRFGAPPNLELAKGVPVVPFDGDKGEEEPLADLTIREPLGDESQHL